MGLPVGLMPMSGTIITEIEAIETLTGACAIPISAGGISGAEGSVVLVLRGTEHQIRLSIDLLASIIGERAPRLRIPACENCPLTDGEVVCPCAGREAKVTIADKHDEFA